VASYGDLVLQHFGQPGAALLQMAIAVHVMGVMISYNGGWAWL
jgi:amino acid permease